MKRHIKLFEEFGHRTSGHNTGSPVYLVLWSQGEGGSSAGSYDGQVVAVTGSRQEANAIRKDYQRKVGEEARMNPSRTHRYPGVNDVWIKEIDPTDSDEVFYAFHGAADSPNGQELIDRMIELGLDDTEYRENPFGY